MLQIQTQSENPTRIYPPQLIIEYATASAGSFDEDDTILFKVEYTMPHDNFWSSVQIMNGFLFAFGIVIVGIRINNWYCRQRATNQQTGSTDTTMLGLHAMMHAFMVACHTFAWLFSSFLFLICTYWLLFVKLQTSVFLLLPSVKEFHGETDEYLFFKASFQAIFWAETVYVAYIIAQQCTSDIIFVDWENPRRGKSGHGASMWRLVKVVNEFNRMQPKRSSSIEFTLLFICLVMVGLGQSRNSLPQPGSSDDSDYENKSNIALAFGSTCLWWMAAVLIQWAWRSLFFERWITEPPSTKFQDLCSVCNISVFTLVENHMGFYLHGKSPHNTADCSMEDLLKNLEREGNGLLMTRGLEGAPDGCQSFAFFASPVFRAQLNRIYETAHGKAGDSDITGKVALARAELTQFLKRFVDKQPSPPRDGLRYNVREALTSERILRSTPAEFRTNEEPGCCMLSSATTLVGDISLSATFLGLELDLVLHDILTYNIISMASNNNVGLSIFLTYVMHLLRTSIRSFFGLRNLAKKALIDPRFIE